MEINKTHKRQQQKRRPLRPTLALTGLVQTVGLPVAEIPMAGGAIWPRPSAYCLGAYAGVSWLPFECGPNLTLMNHIVVYVEVGRPNVLAKH